MSRRNLLLLALSLPTAVTAQAAAYRRTPGDTLRFREVTTSEITLRTPRGDLPMRSGHDALIAVTFLPGDSARAWYDGLTLEASGPAGTQRPATRAALRQPFTLAFDARGNVRTLAAPTFPASFRGITDLTHQFDDFFLRLPAQPLRVGLAWTDSVARRDSARSRYTRTTGVAHYRVERDTTVGTRRGVVIAMRQTVRIENGGPVEGQPLTAESVLEGGDEGVFVYAPSEGRILGRTRTGEVRGTVTFRGGPQPVAMEQRYRYQNTLTPIGR